MKSVHELEPNGSNLRKLFSPNAGERDRLLQAVIVGDGKKFAISIQPGILGNYNEEAQYTSQVWEVPDWLLRELL
jgi:hypothetical protein